MSERESSRQKIGHHTRYTVGNWVPSHWGALGPKIRRLRPISPRGEGLGLSHTPHSHWLRAAPEGITIPNTSGLPCIEATASLSLEKALQ